ncbi:phospholipid transport system transporter-binding protein [Formivibrio citricus]|uniref:Phospholipid transport system transporter-binding protein n=1 Tax=Formivibrio citricus TaxID=83765 RepID=A0A1I5DCB5_9NEIS|nr:STAS domain-containing protein [Formivibrio citricus]SFN96853.1 phospholipid transport system transporter-binding protein [Formivibrio citricus]
MSTSLQISGPLTFDTAARQLDSLGVPGPGSKLQVDFSGVTEVDSAAVALLLHWSRQARAAGAELEFIAVPSGLHQLMGVYGLKEILPQAG